MAKFGYPMIFLTFYANGRDPQVEIAEKYRDKTDFTSDHGLLYFTCMAFGLKNEPGTV